MRLAVLSPHRDDAAFSCGLLLTQLLHAGVTVQIVNVCTQSEYAPYLPETGELRVAQVSGKRHVEDLCFLQALHAASATTACTMADLGWFDSPLRLGIPADAVLEVQEVATGDVRRLARALAPWAAFDVILAPLGLGCHIDHRLVRDAACAAIPRARLGFYQDLPYACWMSPDERNASTRELLRTSGYGPLPAWRAPAYADAASAFLLKQSYAVGYSTQIAPDLADLIASDAARHHGAECLHLPPSLAKKLSAALQHPQPCNNSHDVLRLQPTPGPTGSFHPHDGLERRDVPARRS